MPVPDVPPSPSHWGLFCRIQHLGAEIHLIRDLMDPLHTGGLYDFLLTALEVRDRNALAPGTDPFPATILGMSLLTFTTCVPLWEGSSRSPWSCPCEKGPGRGGHSASPPWGPQVLMCFRLCP